MTEIEYTTIEHLDFDYAPLCEAFSGEINVTDRSKDTLRQDCPNTAVFRVYLIACCDQIESVRLWCADCLDEKLNSYGVTCQYCLTTFVPASDAYKRIESL